jgi:hypothetical protein
MIIPKQIALEYIRNAQLAEYVAYASDTIDVITHINACALLQKIEHQIEKSPLTEFEGED